MRRGCASYDVVYTYVLIKLKSPIVHQILRIALFEFVVLFFMTRLKTAQKKSGPDVTLSQFVL